MKWYRFDFYRQLWPNGGRGEFLGSVTRSSVLEAEAWAADLRVKMIFGGHRLWMEVKAAQPTNP